jgi:hypothetical protein
VLKKTVCTQDVTNEVIAAAIVTTTTTTTTTTTAAACISINSSCNISSIVMYVCMGLEGMLYDCCPQFWLIFKLLDSHVV